MWQCQTPHKLHYLFVLYNLTHIIGLTSVSLSLYKKKQASVGRPASYIAAAACRIVSISIAAYRMGAADLNKRALHFVHTS
jgi:hypothetical protein